MNSNCQTVIAHGNVSIDQTQVRPTQFNTVKLGYKVTVYNINLFTTTRMVGTDSMVSVLNVLVTTTPWL